MFYKLGFQLAGEAAQLARSLPLMQESLNLIPQHQVKLGVVVQVSGAQKEGSELSKIILEASLRYGRLARR